eukprot:gene23078-29270_t
MRTPSDNCATTSANLLRQNCTVGDSGVSVTVAPTVQYSSQRRRTSPTSKHTSMYVVDMKNYLEIRLSHDHLRNHTHRLIKLGLSIDADEKTKTACFSLDEPNLRQSYPLPEETAEDEKTKVVIWMLFYDTSLLTPDIALDEPMINFVNRIHRLIKLDLSIDADEKTKDVIWMLHDTSLLTPDFSLDEPTTFGSRVHYLVKLATFRPSCGLTEPGPRHERTSHAEKHIQLSGGVRATTTRTETFGLVVNGGTGAVLQYKTVGRSTPGGEETELICSVRAAAVPFCCSAATRRPDPRVAAQSAVTE